MCTSTVKAATSPDEISAVAIARIKGRPVLQPACNRVPAPDRGNSLKKNLSPKSPPPPPISPPKSKSPRPPATKRGSVVNGLNSSSDKVAAANPRCTAATKLERKKFKQASVNGAAGFENTSGPNATAAAAAISYSSSLITEAPGSIAAVRREQVALQQAQRKMRIAHYGRTKSGKFEAKIVSLTDSSTAPSGSASTEEKRCSFITPNSGLHFVLVLAIFLHITLLHLHVSTSMERS